ncbi:YhcN/YlaJ family sporulation lipoprotein [Aneurinibacillus tyrosinisolvens]|uniref:YhcN/YlaJ family sporulation lipoprotein n=1 Tax=Aneurinibacillus tyrosinisolvens TaxID=1443435 RepID=UPI0013792ED2|nr:YhcN/YlaJ family sporulation lipoprotein [Aneurinibacillus tyrosinisolvens]
MIACNQDGTPNNAGRTQGYQANEYRTNGVASDSNNNHPNDIHSYSVWPYRGTSPFDHPGSRFTTIVNDHPIAERIAQLAANVPGVSHTTTFVYGNDIIVGIDIKNNGNRQMIEQQVRENLEAAEPGCIAHVTADPALHQQVRALGSQLRDRRPTQTFVDDMDKLIRDMDRSVIGSFH